MADWDSSSPADSDIVSQFPANERAARAAVATNFAVDHEETVGDANIGRHLQVSLPERGSDPTTVAALGSLYTKDVSGTTEAFYRDAAGNVVQLTTAGRVRGQSKFVTKTGNYTAVAGDCIFVDKSGGNVTITLPAAPALGDEPITIVHAAGASNTLTIGRNSLRIMDLAEDMTMGDYSSVRLAYQGASPGWRIVSAAIGV